MFVKLDQRATFVHFLNGCVHDYGPHARHSEKMSWSKCRDVVQQFVHFSLFQIQREGEIVRTCQNPICEPEAMQASSIAKP